MDLVTPASLSTTLLPGLMLASLLAAEQPPPAPQQPKDQGYERLEPGPTRTAPTQGLSRMNLDNIAIDFYLKKPPGQGTWPGIVLVHDGGGMSPGVLRLVDELASKGFIVIAPDLYGGKYALDDDKARELSVVMDEQAALAILDALAAHLKNQVEVGDHRVGIVGFDTGGRLAMKAAIGSRDVSAVAVVYARSPGDPETIRRVGCPLMAVFAGKDDMIPPRESETLREALEAMGDRGRVAILPGAGHGFMKDTDPRYDPSAAGQAWARIVAFLRENL